MDRASPPSSHSGLSRAAAHHRATGWHSARNLSATTRSGHGWQNLGQPGASHLGDAVAATLLGAAVSCTHRMQQSHCYALARATTEARLVRSKPRIGESCSNDPTAQWCRVPDRADEIAIRSKQPSPRVRRAPELERGRCS